jgi:LPXTG-site transpeptidase (sortase) family protein
VADISRPRVKGIEFIKAPSKLEAQKPLQQKIETAALEVSAPVFELKEPSVSHSLEYYDNNVDSLDFDLLEEGDYYDKADVGIALGVEAELVGYQPINFVEQYFERTNKKPKTVHHHKKLLPVVKQSMKKVSRKHVYRAGALTALVGVIAFGGYLVTDSFFVNQEAKAVINQSTAVATTPVLTETTGNAATSAQSDTSQTTQNTSSTSSAAGAAASSSIAPDQPKTIKIQKLGINASVVKVGLTSSGAIDTPTNIWNAAWYTGSAKPGNSGAVLIDGHSSATRGALFGNLDRLAAGDQIQVVRGDGTVITYSVAYTTIVNRNNVDMGSMLKTYDGADKGLNIITCTGKWIDSEKTLENRVLIYAKQI